MVKTGVRIEIESVQPFQPIQSLQPKEDISKLSGKMIRLRRLGG